MGCSEIRFAGYKRVRHSGVSLAEFTRAEDLREGWIQILLLQQRAPPDPCACQTWRREAVFEVEDGVELRESQGLKVKELAKAEALAEEGRELIIRMWHEHLDR